MPGLTPKQFRKKDALTCRIERWAQEFRGKSMPAEQAAALLGCSPDQFRKAVRNLRADGRDCVEAVIMWRAKEPMP